MKLLVIVLFFMTHQAWAEKVHCGILQGRGCLYIPSSAKSKQTGLHFFIRGHYKGMANVPKEHRTQAALAALNSNSFQLKQLAERTGVPVLVSSSSLVSLGSVNLKHLKEFNLKIDSITISSHSGGYQGPNRTLLAFNNQRHLIDRIFMLDNFYSTKGEMVLDILSLYSHVQCEGFTTAHNADRARKFYQNQKINCRVEGPAGMDHNNSVAPFLQRHF